MSRSGRSNRSGLGRRRLVKRATTIIIAISSNAVVPEAAPVSAMAIVASDQLRLASVARTKAGFRRLGLTLREGTNCA